MTLSTVRLKLVHQPLDQDKLFFYFGHGKWHSPIRCFPPLSQDCDSDITSTPCTHQTDSFVVDFIIIRNLYDDMAFHFIQTSESLSSIQSHQAWFTFTLLSNQTLFHSGFLLWFHVSYMYPFNLVILVSPFNRKLTHWTWSLCLVYK
jgi:hypothetical protein